MQRLLEIWGKLPTTQVRVTVTLGAVIFTTVRYVFSHTGWVPDITWLTFLLAMSGVDAAQFLVKRTTDTDYVAAKAGTSTGGTP